MDCNCRYELGRYDGVDDRARDRFTWVGRSSKQHRQENRGSARSLLRVSIRARSPEVATFLDFSQLVPNLPAYGIAHRPIFRLCDLVCGMRIVNAARTCSLDRQTLRASRI